MTFLGIYFLGLLAILSLMTALWFVSVFINDVSIVDIFWGFGYVVACIVYFALTDGYGLRKVLITTLVLIWGLRLTTHLAIRNIGKGEDPRYQRMRKRYGPGYWWISFFQVFMLQGVLMWLVSAPLLAAQFHSGPAYITLFDIVGLLLWMIGFTFEAVGDWQLVRFRSNPQNKGRILDTGLWRYTRHPNYFGDAVQWWAFFIVAIGVPWGFLTIYSPIIMTYLLIFVSGVAMLERSMRKKPKYDEYIQRTSAFFPMPPRNPRPSSQTIKR